MERKLKGYKYRQIKGVDVVPFTTLVIDVMWGGTYQKFNCRVLEVKHWFEYGTKIKGVTMVNVEGHQLYREYWGDNMVTKATAYYE